jgi:uncharacterized protein YlxW (UPF0749 family)
MTGDDPTRQRPSRSEPRTESGTEPAPAPAPARAHPLLEDLVHGSLDPGYAQAAARRAGRPAARQWWETPAVALGCLLAGFLLVVGYVHTHRTAPQSQHVQDELAGRVRAVQAADESLTRRAAALDRQLAAARSQALPAGGALAQRLTRVEAGSGLLAVTGPGLVVTLTEPPPASPSTAAGRAGTVPLSQTNILTDRDIRSVVNELWHDGAEAIAVNGIRLTPTSAIRFAGQAVLVDFRSITSPYRIEAIGNADDLATGFAQSDVASRYKTLSGADGIGFTFTGSDGLSLPAGSPETLRYAQAGR